MKPYSESCEQNRAPILEVLRIELAGRERLLEIGSGTGQHAVYFAPEFPELLWQTSDMADMHAGIHAWLAEQGCGNILPPLALDVCRDSWPRASYDAVFSANTAHIMDWKSVQCLFAGIGRVLQTGDFLAGTGAALAFGVASGWRILPVRPVQLRGRIYQ